MIYTFCTCEEDKFGSSDFACALHLGSGIGVSWSYTWEGVGTYI